MEVFVAFMTGRKGAALGFGDILKPHQPFGQDRCHFFFSVSFFKCKCPCQQVGAIIAREEWRGGGTLLCERELVCFFLNGELGFMLAGTRKWGKSS